MDLHRRNDLQIRFTIILEKHGLKLLMLLNCDYYMTKLCHCVLPSFAVFSVRIVRSFFPKDNITPRSALYKRMQ